jgi:hypothetical protein
LDGATQAEYKMSIMAPQAGDYLFVGGIYDQSVLLKLAADKPAVTEVCGRRGIQSVRSYDAVPRGRPHLRRRSPGPLTAVKWKRANASGNDRTGHRQNQTGRSATAFLVKGGDRFFIFNEGRTRHRETLAKGYEEISRQGIEHNIAFGRGVV